MSNLVAEYFYVIKMCIGVVVILVARFHRYSTEKFPFAVQIRHMCVCAIVNVKPSGRRTSGEYNQCILQVFHLTLLISSKRFFLQSDIFLGLWKATAFLKNAQKYTAEYERSK